MKTNSPIRRIDTSAVPAPEPNGTPRTRLVPKHPLALRWMHWINFPVLLVMIWSGVLILWAYDNYPSESVRLRVPNRVSISRVGVTPVYADKDEVDYPVPAEQRRDILLGFRLAEGMAWHFSLAWVFTLNGVAYVLYLWLSGEWKHIVPRKNSLIESGKVIFHDLGLYRRPLPPGKYNHAQRIAYSSVVLMGIGMVVTGLAIYKPAQLSWLASLLGGYQAARLEHFLLTACLIAFFLVHVLQVARAGWNNFRSMITGYELSRQDLSGNDG